MAYISTNFEGIEFPGTDWKTPGRSTPSNHVPLEQNPDSRGGLRPTLDISNSSACYIGAGEFATDQWAQATLGEAWDFTDYAAYYDNYGDLQVWLNLADPDNASNRGGNRGYFAINGYYTAYDEVLLSISLINNSTGAGVNTSFTYYPKELFFDGDEVPVGCRLRLERIGTTYNLYFYTPHVGEWHLVESVTQASALINDDGYPGVSTFSRTTTSVLINDFRASDDSATFLTGNLGGPPGIHDDFARTSIGSDWESPTQPTAFGDEPLGIPVLGSVGRGSPRTDSFFSSGIYTGNGEFTQMEQWVEIEYNKDVRTGDQTNYTAYTEDFQSPYVGLHHRPQSEENYQSGRLSFGALFYSNYPELYKELRTRKSGVTSVQTGLDYTTFSPGTILGEDDIATGATVIPKGTKLRLEYVGDTYYGYVYSPVPKSWFLIGQVTPTEAPSTPGYPMLRINGYKDTPDPAPERFTNFRAGERGDGTTFLTKLPGPHFDDFNRASIGSDYENPGQITIGGVTGAMTIPSPGYIQAASITPTTAGMTYIGQGEFWSKDQWAEAEFAEDVVTGDAASFTAYYSLYGTMFLRLNMLPLADADKQGAAMFFGPSYLPSSSPVHDVGMVATAKNAAGANSLTNTSQWTGNVSVLFGGDPSGDTGGFIPAGTKIRFERLDEEYSVYCWSPTKGAWFLLSRVEVNPGNDMAENGSPGVGTYTYTDVDNVRITNFRCGQRGDGSDFLGQYGFKQDATDGFGFPVNDEWFMRRRKLRRRREALLRAKKEEDDE